MTFIIARRGATAWDFQIGRVYWFIRYPSFWTTSGPFGPWRIDQTMNVLRLRDGIMQALLDPRSPKYAPVIWGITLEQCKELTAFLRMEDDISYAEYWWGDPRMISVFDDHLCVTIRLNGSNKFRIFEIRKVPAFVTKGELTCVK